MSKNFERYLEVKAEIKAGRITKALIPGGVEWFDADELAYNARVVSRPATRSTSKSEEKEK